MSKPKRVLNGNRKQLHKYVRHMADLTGLRDWTITLLDGNPEQDDSLADCNVVYGQKHARLHYRDDWPEHSADVIRWITTHELLHCHFWEMDQRFSDLSGLVGEPVWQVAELAHRSALEHALDGIAREWADHLPLPVKEKVA